MNWITALFTTQDSVAHIALLYALVIAVGVLLGKIRIFGISLGVTFVLFAGIIAGHIGFTGTPAVLNFLQDFGLILFVFCIGLQVGPSFFTSFKEGGVTMNLMSVGIILLNIITMLALYWLVFDHNDPKNLPMMVGVLCGAVTNTPGLGAANEALEQVFPHGTAPQIAAGYACAYPLGVVGIILSMILLKFLMKINTQKESDEFLKEESNLEMQPHRITLEVQNPNLEGKTLKQIHEFLGRQFVPSRILQGEHTMIPTDDTVLHIGDKLRLVCADHDTDAIRSFIGKDADVDWEHQDLPVVFKRILVTQPSVNGKTFGSFHFAKMYGVNVTRITRQGMELFAREELPIQIGDRIRVVGPEDAVERVADLMGNSERRLNAPNIATIFIGILVGIIFGSIPFSISGIPTPVKLGLAGGPLIIAILLGAYGYKFKLVTYTSTSANFMLREIGLVLFLASVGIKAGEHFVQTVVEGDGLTYVWCGFLITILPLLIVGFIARWKFKKNYFIILGMLAGTTTDPPALAYANQTAGNDAPAIGYSTVYPLSMFLRIITAQLIILLLC